CGTGSHTGTDVNGDAAYVVVHQLALACVQPGPHLDPERADAIADGAGAADRPRRAVEGGEEAVAQRLHLAPPEAGEFAAHGSMVAVQHRPPSHVSEFGGPLGRAHN